MSFGTKERSPQWGSPVELYDIALGSEEWHLCSSEEPQSLDEVEYVPTPLLRDNIPVGADERTNEFRFTIPSSHEFAQKYVYLVPGQKAFVTIRRFHRVNAYDDSIETIQLFIGVVQTVVFTENTASATISVAPLTDNISLPVPRYVFSGLCNHVLGDRWCTKNLETGSTGGLDYKHVGSASAVSGIHLVVAGIVGDGYPDNFFTGGSVVTAAGDRRLIVHQTGNNITLYTPLFEGTALEGNNVTLYAGCDHSLATCESKFNNVINYGGFPYVPLVNPFQTGLL